MPENKIIVIGSYTPKSTDVYFFDNNIWMYIFCPIANFQKDKRQKIYSKFFENILSRKLPIFVNSLVLSEFANRYLKLDFDLCNRNSKTYYSNFKKDYVRSKQYQKTVTEIKMYLKQIIKCSQKCSDEFNSINLDEVFALFEKIGFNDSYYLHLANQKKWVIVSDDSDFTGSKVPNLGLTILTR